MALLVLVVLAGHWRGLDPWRVLVELARVIVFGLGAAVEKETRERGGQGGEEEEEVHVGQGELVGVETAGDENAPPAAPASPTPRHHHRVLQAYHLVLAAFNIAAVLVVNVGFVLLNANQTAQVQTALKTGLAVFKIAWNGGLLPALDALVLPGYTRHSLAEAKAQLYGSASTYLALLLIFNSVFAPLFSSAVAHVTCFKNVFYAAAPVFVSYSYETCEAYYGSYWWQACLRDKAVVTRFSYTPSFNYTYKCSSNILTLYVPVFIQQFLISTFTGPLLELFKWALFTYVPVAAIKAALLEQVSPLLLPRAARVERCRKARADKAAAADRVARDRKEHKLTLAVLPVLGAARIPVFWKRQGDVGAETEAQRAKRLQDEADNRKPVFFSGDSLLNGITNMIIVLLTFGLVAPLLGLVVVFVLVFQTTLLEATVAAFLRREVRAEDERKAEMEPALQTEVGMEMEMERERETGRETSEGAASVVGRAALETRARAAVTACLHALAHMRRLVLLLGAVVAVGVLPVVTVISATFSGLAYPEGWVTTVAYVGGQVPAVVLLVVWAAALGAFRGLLHWNGRARHGQASGAGAGAEQEVGPKVKTLPSGDDAGATGEPPGDTSTAHDATHDAALDSLDLAALALDSQTVTDDALHSIASVVQALSGLFLCVFLMDIMGATAGWRAAVPLAAVALLLPLLLGVVEMICGWCYSATSKSRQRVAGPGSATSYPLASASSSLSPAPSAPSAPSALHPSQSQQTSSDVETGEMGSPSADPGSAYHAPRVRAKPTSTSASPATRSPSSSRVVPVEKRDDRLPALEESGCSDASGSPSTHPVSAPSFFLASPASTGTVATDRPVTVEHAYVDNLRSDLPVTLPSAAAATNANVIQSQPQRHPQPSAAPDAFEQATPSTSPQPERHPSPHTPRPAASPRFAPASSETEEPPAHQGSLSTMLTEQHTPAPGRADSASRPLDGPTLLARSTSTAAEGQASGPNSAPKAARPDLVTTTATTAATAATAKPDGDAPAAGSKAAAEAGAGVGTSTMAMLSESLDGGLERTNAELRALQRELCGPFALDDDDDDAW